ATASAPAGAASVQRGQLANLREAVGGLDARGRNHFDVDRAVAVEVGGAVGQPLVILAFGPELHIGRLRGIDEIRGPEQRAAHVDDTVVAIHPRLQPAAAQRGDEGIVVDVGLQHLRRSIAIRDAELVGEVGFTRTGRRTLHARDGRRRAASFYDAGEVEGAGETEVRTEDVDAAGIV